MEREVWQVGAAAAVLVAVASCGGSPEAPSPLPSSPAAPAAQELRGSGVVVEFQAADAAWAPLLHADAVAGTGNALRFFGSPLAGELRVRVFPDRAALTSHWRLIWRDPSFQSECWMIASGDEAGVALLSPGAWPREACGHDPQDTVHRGRISAHEVVHVYHARHNPAWAMTASGMAWLTEGLAVHASGQYDEASRASVRHALAATAPQRLADVLPAGYAFAGSLVAWVDRRFGRAVVVDLLDDTQPRTVLERLGSGEAELLASWRADVVDGR